MEKIIPYAATEKFLKEAGAQRISEEAKKEFRRILEEIGRDVAKRAVTLAAHGKRKTVNSDDVALAASE